MTNNTAALKTAIDEAGNGIALKMMNIAGAAAVEYCKRSGVAVTRENSGKLADILMVELKTAAPTAVDELLTAAEHRVSTALAEANLSATARLAGIHAAQTFIALPGVRS